MPDESWTILKLLQWTTDYFKRNNVSEPRASAEVLLAHVLSEDRLYLYLNYDQPLDARELSAFRKCIKRRLAGEPNQHITGTQEFWSLPLRVNPNVLISRPETEILVQAALEFAASAHTSISIMDLGTGSGAIAIALAREIPGARIVATDLSMVALRLARDNARLNKVAGQISFVRSEMFAAISPHSLEFNLVVTNPPYVSRKEFSELPREIRDHEPLLALDGGVDGLTAIKHIILVTPTILSHAGALIMEMGAGQAESVSTLVRDSQQYEYHRIIKDYSGIDRVLLAIKQ